MKIQLASSYQTLDLRNSCLAWIYRHLDTHHDKPWIRVVGPITGCTSALLDIATQIALIAENLLKGLVNLCRGSGKELVLKQFKIVLLSTLGLSLCLLLELYGLALETIKMAQNPQDHLAARRIFADRTVRESAYHNYHQFSPTQQRDFFKALERSKFANPDDPMILWHIGICYMLGFGTAQDLQKGQTFAIETLVKLRFLEQHELLTPSNHVVFGFMKEVTARTGHTSTLLYQQVKKHYITASNAGSAEGQWYLDKFLEKGLGETLTKL